MGNDEHSDTGGPSGYSRTSGRVTHLSRKDIIGTINNIKNVNEKEVFG